MISKENCIFNNIILKKQNISKEIINNLMVTLYNNISFSTFPYLIYKEYSSKNCINKYNSGNCIAISYFIKQYLKTNYNIDSYVIGASVPNVFKVDGTPHICHCALCIPISLHEFYIIDGALYFLEPMYCNLKDNKIRQIENSDIYTYQKMKINYNIELCNDCILDIDYEQILKEDSICVRCNFDYDIYETWNYYLNEIINPDNNIGHAFLTLKPQPFILHTYYDNKEDIVKLLYKIKLNEDGELNISKYPKNEIIYKGLNYKQDKIATDIIEKKLYKFFSNYI